ncbi:MAG: hypothetical protein EOP09_19150 [Proteobacteria bacterium]|nr:MAG: hypothetical protein EOP09_19150 [Pseudomonadota bacterium]
MSDENNNQNSKLREPGMAFSSIGDLPALSHDSSPDSSKGLVLPDQMLPPNLFVLPSVSPIIFPTLMAPVMISEPRFVATIEESINRNRLLGIIVAKTENLKDSISPDDLYEYGVVVKILKRLKLQDGSVNLLVHSLKRFKRKKTLSEQPYIVVETEYLEDEVEKSTEMDALTRSVIQNVKRLSESNPFFTEEMRLAMINAPGPGTIADLVAFSLALPRDESQKFLEILPVKKRFEALMIHLRREQDVADVQKRISDEVNQNLNQMQREFFLRFGVDVMTAQAMKRAEAQALLDRVVNCA